ncbi:polysaccharide deacetylase family protein [Hydrogenimonas sp.]
MPRLAARWLLAAWFFVTAAFADAHIFVYHRFGDNRHPSTSTALDELRREFDYFKTHGYQVVPLSRLVAALKKGENIPDNWVVLTIDDSYRSFYEKGLPIFVEYGYPFTLFVYTKATEAGYGDFMSWKQVNEAKKHGELGFHSHSHPHMVSKSDAFLQEDFQKGLALMRKRTGERPRYFAYPYGEYDARVRRIAESFGFDAICNQNVGAVSRESSRFDLDRIALTGRATLADKLRIRYLSARWLAPEKWPEKGVLTDVHIRLKPETKDQKGWLYLTDYGWQRVSVKGAQVRCRLDKPLRNRRSRLILKLQKDKINTKILVKP